MNKFLLLTWIVFTGCSVSKMTKQMYGDTYSYHYKMVSPSTDTNLIYEDNTCRFVFTITNTEIDFVLKNKGNETLKVNWDDASIVQFGKAKKIMHKGVKYADRNSSMSPTSIPPDASLDDLAVPTESIYYREGYYSTYSSIPGGWETHDLYPTHDMNDAQLKAGMSGYNGSKLSLYLPVHKTDGKEIGYTFSFQIDSVKCITCKS